MGHAVDVFSSALRFRASAGDVRMSILLVGGVLDLCGQISSVAEMVLFRLSPDQNVVPTPRSRGFAPLFPLLSHPPIVGGAKGLGRELIFSSLTVLLLRGPTGPSLTLAGAPLTREHRRPPIPARHWLLCGSRSTGAPDDTAAQGWDLGPQLGARLRSPITCRPVRDTVCASFCREYLNTSLLAMGCVPGGFRKANPTQ